MNNTYIYIYIYRGTGRFPTRADGAGRWSRALREGSAKALHLGASQNTEHTVIGVKTNRLVKPCLGTYTFVFPTCSDQVQTNLPYKHLCLPRHQAWRGRRPPWIAPGTRPLPLAAVPAPRAPRRWGAVLRLSSLPLLPLALPLPLSLPLPRPLPFPLLSLSRFDYRLRLWRLRGKVCRNAQRARRSVYAGL